MKQKNIKIAAFIIAIIVVLGVIVFLVTTGNGIKAGQNQNILGSSSNSSISNSGQNLNSSLSSTDSATSQSIDTKNGSPYGGTNVNSSMSNPASGSNTQSTVNTPKQAVESQANQETETEIRNIQKEADDIMRGLDN